MSKFTHIMAITMAAPWLGYGRTTECFLALVAGLYGISLFLFPFSVIDTPQIVNIMWFGYIEVFAGILILQSTLSGTGLVFNILAYPHSKWFRFFGALIGVMIWTWWASNSTLLGYMGLSFFFCVVASLFSLRIMCMALIDLPESETWS